MSKIIVLGCGPAGLMAAHAAAIANHDVQIYSKKRKSFMRGAQYLHLPIPMVSGSPFQVSYLLEGDLNGYRDKVYGDPRVQVSPSSLQGDHNAWDMREAYDNLWSLYSNYVHDTDLTPEVISALIHDLRPDLVINTVPRPATCSDPNHIFGGETVWVTEYYRGPKDRNGPEDLVICSGERDVPWYRTSRIRGFENTEYPAHTKPPLSADKLHEVVKPLKTTCTCDYGMPSGDWINAGRYGTWTKGVLSHSAFYDVLNRLVDLDKMEVHNQ